MTLSQLSTPFITRTHEAHSFNVTEAIERGEFVLSLSTMLGCDYIFLSHKGHHKLLEQKQLETTIRELLDLLEISPQQSMVVGADETIEGKLAFTRYDFQWENRQVSNVIDARITHTEQTEFMQMMLDCSTTC